MADEDARKEAIAFINSKFTDVASLKSAASLIKLFSNRKLELEHQLGVVESEQPSQIKQTFLDAEELAKEASALKARFDDISRDSADEINTAESIEDQLSATVEKLKDIERLHRYLQVVSRIEGFSSDIQSALLIDENEKGVDEFSTMVDFVCDLQQSSCTKLKMFANDTLKYWFDILKNRFCRDFEEILEAHNWPFIKAMARKKSLPNAAELKPRLPIVFTYVLKIHLPSELHLAPKADHLPSTIDKATVEPILLPIALMLRPLKKRFLYHFHGTKQTNSPDKPEWFFTQILTWIKDHQVFLKKEVQPLLDSSNYSSTSAVIEFSRGLVMLAIDKILSDLHVFMEKEGRFCHLVDESLQFQKDLAQVLGARALAKLPRCLDVLAQDEPFEMWLNVEHKRAMDMLDEIMSSSSAWEYQLTDTEHEADKVPGCADSFLTFLTGTTDRYKSLSSVEHRLHFLSLQLELLDDFRLRIVQVRNEQASTPVDLCSCAVLNAVYFVVQVLKDWGDRQFFLELQIRKNKIDIENMMESSEHLESEDQQNSSTSHAKVNQSSGLDTSVFQSVIDLYEHLCRDMLASAISYIADDVTARSRPYRTDRWISLPSQQEFIVQSLSASACEMLTVLRDRLLQAEARLSLALFTTLWQSLAAKLNDYLFHELIEINHFNEGGASQLYFDMFKNLFPLFGAYTKKPENYFKDVKEACILLNLSMGSGILLKEVLYQALHSSNTDHPPTDPVAALHDVKVFKLTLEQAELILSLRVDWRT